jgi:hypothetical protein
MLKGCWCLAHEVFGAIVHTMAYRTLQSSHACSWSRRGNYTFAKDLWSGKLVIYVGPCTSGSLFTREMVLSIPKCGDSDDENLMLLYGLTYERMKLEKSRLDWAQVSKSTDAPECHKWRLTPRHEV